jgi:hypothetical protein
MSRNRAWCKLHLAVDADTDEIIASDLTARRAHDCTPVPKTTQADRRALCVVLRRRRLRRAVRVLLPPRCTARLSPNPSAALQKTDLNIRSTRELGRREWHTQSGYSERSLDETTMYRYKTIIGRSMRSRAIEGQRNETQPAAKILNTMIRFGMPDS